MTRVEKSPHQPLSPELLLFPVSAAPPFQTIVLPVNTSTLSETRWTSKVAPGVKEEGEL